MENDGTAFQPPDVARIVHDDRVCDGSWLTAQYSSNAADVAVQANIVAAGHGK